MSAHKFLIAIAVSSFLLSLALPVFYTTASWGMGPPDVGPTWYGFGILLIGWGAAIGKPDEYWSIAWFANPLFLLGVILTISRNRASLLVACLGLIVAATSISLKRIWNDKEPPSIMIEGYGPGFYLWGLAFVFLLFAAGTLFVQRNKKI